jgi:hypothetical protein
MKIFVAVLAGLAVALALAVAGRHWRRVRHQALYQRAIDEFPQQAADLSDVFLTAANATGKPRGLIWKSCELQGDPLFATDLTTGEIYGLSGATIGFAAIPGGDMEEVEAVGDIRYVTAVFVYRENNWQSDGRAIFNLEPVQALERLQASQSY